MFLPLYSLVMDWVFPLKLSYRIESLRIWEHLMYVLHVLTCGDNGISRDPIDVFLVINLRVPPPEAFVATESQYRPVSAPCQRGQSLSDGHLHHPGALHNEEGVVLPRGWGYVPLAMCLISLSCSWGDTILMCRELCYYSWILWCFSPSTLLWWIEFSLWSYLIGLSL